MPVSLAQPGENSHTQLSEEQVASPGLPASRRLSSEGEGSARGCLGGKGAHAAFTLGIREY